MSTTKRKADSTTDSKDKKRKEEAAMQAGHRQALAMLFVSSVLDLQAEAIKRFIRASVVGPLARDHQTVTVSEYKLEQDGWMLVVDIKERSYRIQCPKLPFVSVTSESQACATYEPTLVISGPGLDPTVSGKADEVLLKLKQAVQSD